MFLLVIFLLAHASEIKWKCSVIKNDPVKQSVAELERENMFLRIQNDELNSANKILERKLRTAKERVEAMEHFVQRAEEEIRKLEEAQSKEILTKNTYKTTYNSIQKWNEKEDKLNFNLQQQSPSRNGLEHDFDYFLKNLKIQNDGSLNKFNFQSPNTRTWMQIFDNRLIISLDNTDQQKATFISLPVNVRIKNEKMLKSPLLRDAIFELYSIGSFDPNKESAQNVYQWQQWQVSIKFVSLRTGAKIIFHYGRRCRGRDYSLNTKDAKNPDDIILQSVGQYGEKIDRMTLKIKDVSVTYMDMDTFIYAVKKRFESYSKKMLKLSKE